ncbi:PucR family transcriptional regulator [Neobacillus thermocopriae]|uniref:PucR family transcriptional regulator n=1 Tax=Neobacillus thermocopriae TaxID=1215031 RepID=A0A6B3TSG5_9BACI|nr:PucR family transcriptional regulator [Neobacillus thermocopriae]MED3622997.1 PucR family transcriptional regulator [Neobacillus thermocopriae]MED3714892.1 PucR family transcriptional regulator [Neobacillus thermocopriae]NEX79286.1 PucR family transcriptional regulator [Neobacillus thermocopriae]
MSSKLHDPFKTSFDSLDEYADLISQVLKCPITIEDANHRLLAYSTHDERTDPARISTIIGRRVPEKVINQLWKEGTIPTLLKTKEPIRVKNMEEIGLSHRVAISIWKQDEVLGFIWALEIDQSLKEEDLALLKKAADAVKNKLLQLQTRKNKKEERFQEFFWKLLTGHLKDQEEILEHFHALQINPPATFAILVFQFKKNISSKEEQWISYLLQTNQRIKILLYTIDCNQLIVLVSTDTFQNPFSELEQFVQVFVEKMNERYGIKDIISVFSSIYEDYQLIGKAYEETQSVLAIKNKFPYETKHIYNYHKLGIYQFFDLLLEKRKVEPYENYSLKKLHEYDQKHNSHLVKTLEVYLNNDANINDAAKELNVHANTLTYRLKRIAEIGEINFKDPNQKMMLYLDLKLEKYKGI